MDDQGLIRTTLPKSYSAMRRRDPRHQQQYRHLLDEQMAEIAQQKRANEQAQKTGLAELNAYAPFSMDHEPIFPSQRYPKRHTDIVDLRDDGVHVASLLGGVDKPRRRRGPAPDQVA
jgi:hypothetical protein